MVRFWPFQLKTDKSDNWWSDVNWFLSHSEFFLNINYHFYRILTGIIKKKVWVDFNCIHITLIINDSYFDSAPNCIEKIFCSHNSAFENSFNFLFSLFSAYFLIIIQIFFIQIQRSKKLIMNISFAHRWKLSEILLGRLLIVIVYESMSHSDMNHEFGAKLNILNRYWYRFIHPKIL